MLALATVQRVCLPRLAQGSCCAALGTCPPAARVPAAAPIRQRLTHSAALQPGRSNQAAAPGADAAGQRQRRQLSQHLSWRQRQQRQPHLQPCSSAAAGAQQATAAAAGRFWPALVQAWATNPAAIILAAAACLFAAALSVFLLAAIPTLLAFRRSAQAAEQLMHALHQEVPDTAAAVRLSSMDLADCIEEVTALGNDLTEGVRASARAIVSTEQSVRQGMDLAGKAVSGYVVPKIKQKGQEARGVLEGALRERAALRETSAVVREVAGATKSKAQRLRAALATARLASNAAALVAGVRAGQQGSMPPPASNDPALGGA